MFKYLAKNQQRFAHNRRVPNFCLSIMTMHNIISIIHSLAKKIVLPNAVNAHNNNKTVPHNIHAEQDCSKVAPNTLLHTHSRKH